MPLWKQALMRRYHAPAGNDGADGGGGSAGGADDAAATAAAEKAAAEKAAAEKAAADAAAAAAANEGTKPSDAEAKLLKDVMKHKDAAKAAQAEVDRLKAEVAKFTGIDPEKVRSLLEQQAEEERKKAEARGEYDRLVKQMADSHKSDREGLVTQLSAKDTQINTLQQQIAEITVGQAFSNSSLVSGKEPELTLTPAKARVIYGSHFEFKDGKVIGFDKPAGASERTPLVDAAGQPLSFDEALKKLVDADPDKDQLYRSKVKPGAGSSTQPPKGAAAAAAAAAASAGLSSIGKIAAGLKARQAAK